MDKIQFDIKFRPQIESGEYKVETRDGRPARIICWDRNNQKYPIVCLLDYGNVNGEFLTSYTNLGNSVVSADGDLFIITTEPELSEFEEAVGAEIFDPPFNEEQIKVIKEESAKLLELAKKELCESGEVTDWYAKGKAEALKDLPRWVKVNKGDLLDKHSNYLLCSNEGYYYCRGNTITRDGYMLLVDNLEKLPKEDEK